jgi:hypothetical protein
LEGDSFQAKLGHILPRDREVAFVDEEATQSHSSCPDLIRASIHLRNKLLSKRMDHRVKPGDDKYQPTAAV